MPACVSLLSYNVYPSIFLSKINPANGLIEDLVRSIMYSSSYETPYHLFINKDSIPPVSFLFSAMIFLPFSLLWAFSFELWAFFIFLLPLTSLPLTFFLFLLFAISFQLTAMIFFLWSFSLQLWAMSFFLWSFCLSLCYQLTAMSHELFAISFQLWALSFFFPLPIHQSVELSG